MDESLYLLGAPVAFILVGLIFFVVIELRIKMLKCRG
ncbi:Uncharacterised protein [uncultured archaeon]|nr:Uncharacterised protein [uncultured archaeon]